jgi:hypothetical protein
VRICREDAIDSHEPSPMHGERIKVEIHGKLIVWSENAIKMNSHEKYHRGTITEVLVDGDYKVAMDNVTIGSGEDKKQTICTVPASELRFV